MDGPRITIDADGGDVVARCACSQVVLSAPDLVWEDLQRAVRQHLADRHPDVAIPDA